MEDTEEFERDSDVIDDSSHRRHLPHRKHRHHQRVSQLHTKTRLQRTKAKNYPTGGYVGQFGQHNTQLESRRAANVGLLPPERLIGANISQPLLLNAKVNDGKIDFFGMKHSCQIQILPTVQTVAFIFSRNARENYDAKDVSTRESIMSKNALHLSLSIGRSSKQRKVYFESVSDKKKFVELLSLLQTEERISVSAEVRATLSRNASENEHKHISFDLVGGEKILTKIQRTTNMVPTSTGYRAIQGLLTVTNCRLKFIPYDRALISGSNLGLHAEADYGGEEELDQEPQQQAEGGEGGGGEDEEGKVEKVHKVDAAQAPTYGPEGKNGSGASAAVSGGRERSSLSSLRLSLSRRSGLGSSTSSRSDLSADSASPPPPPSSSTSSSTISTSSPAPVPATSASTTSAAPAPPPPTFSSSSSSPSPPPPPTVPPPPASLCFSTQMGSFDLPLGAVEDIQSDGMMLAIVCADIRTIRLAMHDAVVVESTDERFGAVQRHEQEYLRRQKTPAAATGRTRNGWGRARAVATGSSSVAGGDKHKDKQKGKDRDRDDGKDKQKDKDKDGPKDSSSECLFAPASEGDRGAETEPASKGSRESTAGLRLHTSSPSGSSTSASSPRSSPSSTSSPAGRLPPAPPAPSSSSSASASTSTASTSSSSSASAFASSSYCEAPDVWVREFSECLRRLACPSSPEEIFAFSYSLGHVDERDNGWNLYDPFEELERVGIDISRPRPRTSPDTDESQAQGQTGGEVPTHTEQATKQRNSWRRTLSGGSKHTTSTTTATAVEAGSQGRASTGSRATNGDKDSDAVGGSATAKGKHVGEEQRASQAEAQNRRESAEESIEHAPRWRMLGPAVVSIIETYPTILPVPIDVTDEEVAESARYRSKGRFPVAVWRHRQNGAILARSSQPRVGMSGHQSAADQKLVGSYRLAAGCGIEQECGRPRRRRGASGLGAGAGEGSASAHGRASQSSVRRPTFPASGAPGGSLGLSFLHSGHSLSLSSSAPPAAALEPTMYIIDARKSLATQGNRIRGKGVEDPQRYKASLRYLNIGNIHRMRESLVALAELLDPQLCPDGDKHYLSRLDGTRWLKHVMRVLDGAVQIAYALHEEKVSVLVHCSDGWDRTPQLVATTQLLLDPYFRTIKGFAVLVEKEWCSFGHKFSDRVGVGSDTRQNRERGRSPIMIQWLDVIYQVYRQFPTAFEFDERLLLHVADAVTSGIYGTFLFNTFRERERYHLDERTVSVWTPVLQNLDQFTNARYVPVEGPLWPRANLKKIILWEGYFFQHDADTIPSPARWMIQSLATTSAWAPAGINRRQLLDDEEEAVEDEEEEEEEEEEEGGGNEEGGEGGRERSDGGGGKNGSPKTVSVEGGEEREEEEEDEDEDEEGEEKLLRKRNKLKRGMQNIRERTAAAASSAAAAIKGRGKDYSEDLPQSGEEVITPSSALSVVEEARDADILARKGVNDSSEEDDGGSGTLATSSRGANERQERYLAGLRKLDRLDRAQQVLDIMESLRELGKSRRQVQTLLGEMYRAPQATQLKVLDQLLSESMARELEAERILEGSAASLAKGTDLEPLFAQMGKGGAAAEGAERSLPKSLELNGTAKSDYFHSLHSAHGRAARSRRKSMEKKEKNYSFYRKWTRGGRGGDNGAFEPGDGVNNIRLSGGTLSDQFSLGNGQSFSDSAEEDDGTKEEFKDGIAAMRTGAAAQFNHGAGESGAGMQPTHTLSRGVSERPQSREKMEERKARLAQYAAQVTQGHQTEL